ncbi:MAG: MCP four helix bundle domain-containing protein [Magnetococcales bacterium]|nr:MCP four helix bundle domain-containing protein [Magnetococcales bacterium]MBF0115959.1 MCP four helix bundle domain-containing protein [Magnetococcales bacterium]
MALSIRVRLYSGFSFLLLCLLVSALLAVSMLGQLNERVNLLVEEDMEKVRLVSLLEKSLLGISNAGRSIILLIEQDEMMHFANEMACHAEQVRRALDQLQLRVLGLEERRILQRIEGLVAEVLTIDLEVQRVGMLNSNIRAAQLAEQQGQKVMAQAETALDQLVRQMEGDLEEGGLHHRQEERLRAGRTLQRLLKTLFNQELNLLLAPDEVRIEQFLAKIAENEQALLQEHQTLLRKLAGEYAAGVARWEHILQEYLAIFRQVRQLSQEMTNLRATRLSHDHGWPLMVRLRAELQVLMQSSEQLMHAAKEQSEREFRFATWVLSVLFGLSVLIGVVVSWRIARDVNRGLMWAVAKLEAVSLGEIAFSGDEKEQTATDEFGRLRLAVKRLVQAERHVVDMAERLAQDDLSITVQERSPQDRLLNAMKQLLTALRERSELRRMLIVAEKMSGIGQFAVRVAHEVNNPLATASMGLHNIRLLLPAELLQGKLEHRLRQVEGNILRATRVAREMLAYSWSGQPDWQPFDLSDELNEILALLQVGASNPDIVLDLPETLQMVGDRVKIGQVFRNLLQNALDASPAGGTVRVMVRLEEGWIRAEVADQGSGIAPEILPKIFEPFFTTKSTGLGVGLGLPICYSILRQHHGMIEVNNAPEGGVSVTLRFPVRPTGIGVYTDDKLVTDANGGG